MWRMRELSSHVDYVITKCQYLTDYCMTIAVDYIGELFIFFTCMVYALNKYLSTFWLYYFLVEDNYDYDLKLNILKSEVLYL